MRVGTACADEAELRAEVESLLAAHEEAGGFLSEPAIEAPAGAPHAESLEGERLGPWRVLRLLGRGGMGAVYLAERADGQYERQVALKVVKRGMDTDAILARFLRERQILAGLEHPGIARFLDAGITSDSRPYFAMERIEGRPLIQYCEDRRLNIPARLRLFREVCLAVQYAHANLVVHRDLKPSDILVTDDGRVKLLDFGIAKVLDGDGAAEQTTLTVEGLRPLTPEYAAPERLRGGPVTTAADAFGEAHTLQTTLRGAEHEDTRKQEVGNAVAHWWVSRDPAHLDAALAAASAMIPVTQANAFHVADAASWLAAALADVRPEGAADWRGHAEHALGIVYTEGHPWRTSLAGTGR